MPDPEVYKYSPPLQCRALQEAYPALAEGCPMAESLEALASSFAVERPVTGGEARDTPPPPSGTDVAPAAAAAPPPPPGLGERGRDDSSGGASVAAAATRGGAMDHCRFVGCRLDTTHMSTDILSFAIVKKQLDIVDVPT